MEKQQKAGEEAHAKSSLPLFEHTETDNQSDPKQPEPNQSEPEHPTSQNDEKVPVPAFLAGSDEYAKEIESFAEPLLHKRAKDEPTPADTEEPKSFKASEQEVETPPQELGEEERAQPVDEPVIAQPEIPLPPERANISILPWFVVMLLIISGAGFWYKQDVWLDHPWVRSLLINLHMPVEVRNKDWIIAPESVTGNWLKRDDGTQVLVIQGRIENRLYCELSPPKILVQFFDDSGIAESIEARVLPITEPPSMEQVKHAPFVTPELDRVPIEGQGQRGFFLVLESLPEQAADFTLNPIVK